MKSVTTFILIILLFSGVAGLAQELTNGSNLEFTFEEYIGYVKQHHPLLKQANLQLSMGEAQRLKARGGFDPKIEVDYDRKKFKGTTYYDQLDATFKIPTWYGIEFKANFEEHSGDFLDPSLFVPENGLYNAGISFSLGQGLLINERMASLKKARFFLDETEAERDLLVNQLIFEATQAYFEWLEAYNEGVIYNNFLTNAEVRLQGIKRSVIEGDKAAIDSVEVKISVETRKLSLEAASLKTRKAALRASNYLWLNGIPLELQEDIAPTLPNENVLSQSLYLESITAAPEIMDNHPKLKSLDAKINSLKVDRSLKRNLLLPTIDLQYNFLSPVGDQLNSFNTANYKAGFNFSLPLFLRKERGDLRLANLKLQHSNFDLAATTLSLKNKIRSVNSELSSLALQNDLIKGIAKDYETLLAAEERKFQLGESSLFLINSREQKLIETKLKENALQTKYLKATASLYNVLGISEPELTN